MKRSAISRQLSVTCNKFIVTKLNYIFLKTKHIIVIFVSNFYKNNFSDEKVFFAFGL